MRTHCSVFYLWKGRGITQEIKCLYINGQEREEWRDASWIAFLDEMTHKGWELIEAVALSDQDGTEGLVGYFRRLGSK